jgi:hypothetical protein
MLPRSLDPQVRNRATTLSAVASIFLLCMEVLPSTVASIFLLLPSTSRPLSVDTDLDGGGGLLDTDLE